MRECCSDEDSAGCSTQCKSAVCMTGLPVSNDTDSDEGNVSCNCDECFLVFEEKLTAPHVCVKGRLKEHVAFWKDEIGAPQLVIDVINSGYVLPLKSMPLPSVKKNHMSALSNVDFVQLSLDELLANKCVKRVDEMPYICSPLSVVQNSLGKKQLVVNLHYLNRYLWEQKFKYEDLRTAMMLFEQVDYPT